MSTTSIMLRRIMEKMNKDKLSIELKKYLSDTNTVKEFTNFICNTIQNTQKEKNFLYRYVMGDIDQLVPVDEYLTEKKIMISAKQKKCIYDLIQSFLMSEINEFKMIEYIFNTFPLWSYLKKELLKTIPGTNITQWEYAALNSHKYTSEVINNHFSGKTNYKELKNEECAKAISKIVELATGDNQFEKIISQPGNEKGWFPRGFYSPPEQHNVKIKNLFKLAYSFRFDLKKYSHMCTRTMEGVYDCFEYESNIYRFALTYRSKMTFNDVMLFKNNNSKLFDSKDIEPTTSFEKAEKKLEKFFSENNSEDFESIKKKYIVLLNELGISTHKFRKLKIDNIRKEKAKGYIKKLIAETDVKNVSLYCAALHDSVSDLIEAKYKDENDQYGEKRILEKNLNCIMSLAKKSEKAEKPDVYKTTILSCLCEGYYIGESDNNEYLGNKDYAEMRRIINTKFKPSKAGRINNILNDNIEIYRNDILRIGYLQTLIRFINATKDKDKNEMMSLARNIITSFESITNEMLQECNYINLHITFPHDFLLYTALASSVNDRCISEVYQVFLPKNKIKLKREDL